MEENKLIIKQNIPNEEIKNLIYTIREKQVMLDSDVARLFEYATKDLNRNVKNNIERFPDYYCFQLTNEEYKYLRYKNFTLNENGRGQHIDNYIDDSVLKMLTKNKNRRKGAHEVSSYI